MRKTVLPITMLATVLVCLLRAGPVQAQSRVFIAAQGSDGNPCTFALPCRSFQHAHDTVPAGGEIDVLDPAGYGALIITKAISIQGHGYAGIAAASSSNGITVNGNPTDAVNLRGLLIDGVGSGTTGIVFNTGASLNVQDTLIRNFAGFGLTRFGGTASNALFMSNTVAADNGVCGVSLSAPVGSAVATVFLDHVLIEHNGNSGFCLAGGTGSIYATVTGSAAVGNVLDGFHAQSVSTGPVQLMLRDSTSANNLLSGITTAGSNAGLIVRVEHSTVTANKFGLSPFAGQLVSYGDNNIDGNITSDGSPTGTIVLK